MATKTEALANDPSDFKESNEIVYTELNLEKWSIWEPLSSRRSPRARIIERQRVLEDGSRITAKVEIGFTQYGNLSTRDQKIYYVLFKLWDEAGRPETEVSFSLQKIARFLGEEWGSKECRSITRALLQLRGVLFVWENSYFDKNSGRAYRATRHFQYPVRTHYRAPQPKITRHQRAVHLSISPRDPKKSASQPTPRRSFWRPYCLLRAKSRRYFIPASTCCWPTKSSMSAAPKNYSRSWD